MSDPEFAKPKRRFWQIHLSTAVLMMFAAGGIGWLNSILHFTYDDDRAKITGRQPPYEFDPGWLERGWPFTAYRLGADLMDYDYLRMTPEKLLSEVKKMDEGRKWVMSCYMFHGRIAVPYGNPPTPTILLFSLILDIAIGLGMLFTLAFLAESILRRREGRET